MAGDAVERVALRRPQALSSARPGPGLREGLTPPPRRAAPDLLVIQAAGVDARGWAGQAEVMTRLMLATLLVASLLGVGLAFRDPLDPRFAACHEEPTSDCLLDLGTALALQGERHGADRELPDYLADAGRFADAEAIFPLWARSMGWDEADVAEEAGRIAPHLLARDLRAGLDLDAALAGVPDADGGDLWLAGLDLLGRDPFGVRRLAPDGPPTAADKAVVAALARRILEWVREDSPRARPFHLAYAAELHAELGDAEGARAALGEMRARGETATTVSEELIRVAGWDAVREVLDLSGAGGTVHLTRAALASDDPTQAASLLEEAFNLAAGRMHWPDFDRLREVVEAASALALPEARPLADRLVGLADATESPFRVFHQIDAAGALLAAGAGRSEVLGRLDLAEALFPPDPDEVVGISFNIGPVRWKGSGLADDARSQIADIAVAVGDLERAARMLRGMEEPVQGWMGLAFEDLPLSVRDALLATARATLPEDEARYVAGQFARRAVWSDQGEAEIAWALALARTLVDEAVEGSHGDTVPVAVAVVAHRAGDGDLETAALLSLARRALANRDAGDLVSAGHLLAESAEAG